MSSNIVSKKGFDFSFDAEKCNDCGGKCCLGESGYVWINKSEIKALANYLRITTDEVIKKYLYKEHYRFSINEIEIGDNEYACVFFDQEKKNCSIYPVRPTQCREFPFWDDYIVTKDTTYYMCPAIIPNKI